MCRWGYLAGFYCACLETSSCGRHTWTLYSSQCRMLDFGTIYIIRPSRRVRPVVAVVFLRKSVCPVVRPVVVVRPMSDRPGVRPSSSSVLCPSVPLSVHRRPSRQRRIACVRWTGKYQKQCSENQNLVYF